MGNGKMNYDDGMEMFDSQFEEPEFDRRKSVREDSFTFRTYEITGESDKATGLLFQSRKGAIDILKRHKIKMYMVVEAKTEISTIPALQRDLATKNVDASLLEAFNALADREASTAIVTNRQLSEILTERVQEQIMLQYTKDNSSPVQNINLTIDNHGIPHACEQCEHGASIKKEFSKDDSLLEALKLENQRLQETMQNTMITMMKQLNPNVEFDCSSHHYFKKLPTSATFEVFIDKARRAIKTDNLEMFNEAYFSLDSSESNSRHHTKDVSRRMMALSFNLIQQLNKFFTIFEVVTHPDGEAGELISKDEAPKSDPAATDLRNAFSELMMYYKAVKE